MAEMTAIRGSDGKLYVPKDEGEYDLWSMVVIAVAQAQELRSFSYSIGGGIPGGAAAAVATRLETNMHVNNQLVDESMTVYGNCLQFGRYSPAGVTGVAAYTPTFADMFQLEAHCVFSFHVGGEKPDAEGKITWFGEAGGWAGFSNVNLAEIIANNVPTPASARIVRYTVDVGRVQKFWGLFSFPRGAITANMGGPVLAWHRLLCVRARGVQ